MIEYDDLAQSFQARHLAVQMENAVAFSPDTSVGEARTRLLAENFDQAPVVDNGKVVGFVLTRRLPPDHPDALVHTYQTPIGPGNIVSADAPVALLLDWIVDPGLLFIIDGRDVTGFVTVSDFNKQPARAYLYLLLATMEIGLADLARRRFRADQERLLNLLSTDDRYKIEGHYELDKAANVEGDFVSYLEFSQLLRLVGRDAVLRAAVGYDSRNAWDRDVGSLVDLRNEVMHPVRNLVSGKGRLIRVRDLEIRLRRVVRAVAAATGSDTGADA